jgi:hypothetical protein
MNAMPASLKLAVAKGEAVTYTCTHRASQNGAVKDISGWTIQVNIALAGTPLQITAAVVDGPNGVYAWSLTHAQTNVGEQVVSMDIFRIDAGSETEMASGTFEIRKDTKYGS